MARAKSKQQPQAAAAEEVPPWLMVMRGITGMTEAPGSADNPHILRMRDAIAEAYPDMADYCDKYQHDETPWCGLTAAYVMTMAGIRPPYQPPPADDTHRWLWALWWGEDSDWGTIIDAPRLGCMAVMEREGGGHVTLYESTEGNNYRCRGGNQADSVNVSSYPISNVVALVWPKAAGPIPPAEWRELSRGDTGSDVASVQKTLGIPADGDFGPVTEAAVKGFQGAAGLAKDGVVGPNTWGALDEFDRRLTAGDDGISDQLAEAIDRAVADDSAVQAINWPDRGKPPPGYYAGLAKTFALAVTRLNTGDRAAQIMAAASGDPDEDALAWYADEFEELGMATDVAGVDTLRHLFVLMFGLGMRESSGNCFEGRDMSASNTSSDTAEAGLFQTSWNISSCSGEIDKLLAEYKTDPNGFQPTFAKGISPDAEDLDNYGSGSNGAQYQFLAKRSPAFAALVTAVGLRKLRQHWGPINRYEVDLMPAIDDLLIEVQRLMDVEPVPPEPGPDDEPAEVTITVASKGNVKVIINQG